MTPQDDTDLTAPFQVAPAHEIAGAPIEIVAPRRVRTPLMLAAPHSGRLYPEDLLRATRLDRQSLRRSEDSFVDLLFADAPRFGAPLLKARFPRVYVDVNRDANELDPRMFADPLPPHADTRSSRVAAGLGVVARIVADGEDVYRRKLTYLEVKQRLQSCYAPYHAALRRLIDQAAARFGCAILIDCHSMPSAGAPADFVLGDRYGASCAPALTSLVEHVLKEQGRTVARNAPYAGGYVAQAYGRPALGVHVLQIEINRALYMDEIRIAPTDGFSPLRETLRKLVRELSEIHPGALRPARAAE